MTTPSHSIPSSGKKSRVETVYFPQQLTKDQRDLRLLVSMIANAGGKTKPGTAIGKGRLPSWGRAPSSIKAFYCSMTLACPRAGMKPYQVVFRLSPEMTIALGKSRSLMSKLREQLSHGLQAACTGPTDFWIAYGFSVHVLDGQTKHASQIVGCIWLEEDDEEGAQTVIQNLAARDASGAPIVSFEYLGDVLAIARDVAKNAYAARAHLQGRTYACTNQLEQSAAHAYQTIPIDSLSFSLNLQHRLALAKRASSLPTSNRELNGRS